MDGIANTIGGALLGLVLPWIIKFFYHLFRRYRNLHLLGDWYGYHLSYIDGKELIINSDWKIKRGIFRDYSVNYKHNNLEYNGTVTTELTHLIFKFKSLKHKENVIYRFNNPLQSKFDLIPGLWLSYDHDFYICAGGAFISRKEFSTDELHEYFLKYFKIDNNLPLIKISKS